MIEITELNIGDRQLIDDTLSYLMQNEAAHNLQIGGLMQSGDGSFTNTRWWVARESAHVGGVASLTPAFNLLVSRMASTGVVEAFVRYLLGQQISIPGVIGPKPWSGLFADLWVLEASVTSSLEVDEMVYECNEVTFPEVMDGSARFANELDIPWMIEWLDQFYDDTGLLTEKASTDREVTIRRKLETGGFVLWLDESGEVVSLAGYGNPTPNGIRVGPVFTPKQFRGRGYGVAVSVAVTQHLLDSGRLLVYLFTDLGNPVSNHVYRKIGYRPVAEYAVHRFEQS